MEAINSTTVRVTLTPSAGFCIKSSALQSAVCKVTGQSEKPAISPASSSTSGIATPGTLHIPQGQKVFVNFAWDANVPPPPEGSEEEIRKAMAGEELVEDALVSGGGWFVPVIVSEPRNDVDKAGKPSVVLDCVYNSSLKSRTLRDLAFRAFLVELGLQRIEAQHSLSLSRKLSTPNIASKGKLKERTALVPLRLYPIAHPLRVESEKNKKPLIQEVSVSPTDLKGKGVAKQTVPPKSVLKNSSNGVVTSMADVLPMDAKGRPTFAWQEEDERIKLTVNVPRLTREQIEKATLDIEPRRIILNVPLLETLDIDLAMPDAQIISVFGGSSDGNSALMLKRQRDLNVDGAKAEWHIQESVLYLYV